MTTTSTLIPNLLETWHPTCFHGSTPLPLSPFGSQLARLSVPQLMTKSANKCQPGPSKAIVLRQSRPFAITEWSKPKQILHVYMFHFFWTICSQCLMPAKFPFQCCPVHHWPIFSFSSCHCDCNHRWFWPAWSQRILGPWPTVNHLRIPFGRPFASAPVVLVWTASLSAWPALQQPLLAPASWTKRGDGCDLVSKHCRLSYV